MIKEIKTTKAYIRCAESEATSSKYCPYLQPNKKYKADNDDYFTVYTSLLALLECTNCERDTKILEVAVNDEPEEPFPVLGKDAYECKIIKTKDFVPFADADEVSFESTEYRVLKNMQSLYPYEYLDNHIDKIPYFYVPTENAFEKHQTYDGVMKRGYAFIPDLLKHLPSFEPEYYYIAKVKAVGEVKHLGYGRVQLDTFKIIDPVFNTFNAISDPITDTDVPIWFIESNILNGSDDLKLAYANSEAVGEHFRHFAVKHTNLIEQDEYDDEGNIITEQNLLTALELLAHPDKEIRMALLDNISLYENYNLAQFVVQILSHDDDPNVSEKARKAYEKLQCKDRY